MMSEKSMTLSQDIKTMIARRIKVEAKADLAAALGRIASNENLKWPEGDKQSQVEHILNFILEYYGNVSVSEIEKAIDLNAARHFECYIESWGKMTREFISGVLSEFVKWRARNRTGEKQYAITGDVESQIAEDLRLLEFNGTSYNITRNVSEKWEYIKKRVPFLLTIDEKKVEELTEEYKTKSIMVPEMYRNARAFAEDKLKAEKLKNIMLYIIHSDIRTTI